jgi:FSR family fosmidomycin resistance protein-like MFS transporter
MNRRLLATLSFSHLMTDLNQGMLPALLPFFIAERGLTYAAAGGLVLVANVAASAVQPAFGWFADRRPSPWLIPTGVAAAGAGLALAGAAPTYALVAAAVALMGFGAAAFHPEAMRWASHAAGPRRATGMSFFSIGGNLGMATGPLVITPLVLGWGLKSSLVLLLPMLLVAALLASELRRFAAPAVGRHGRGAPDVSAALAPDRWGLFGRLSITVMTRSTVYTALSTFLPLFWVIVLGRTKAEGGVALSVAMGAGVAGTLLGGRLADRYGRRVVVLVAMVLLVPLLLALGSARDVRLAAVLLVPVGVALYVPFSVLVVMGQEYLPNRVGTASGMTLGLAVTAGGIAAPFLGKLADHFGVAAPLLLAAFLPLLGVAAAWTLPDDRASVTVPAAGGRRPSERGGRGGREASGPSPPTSSGTSRSG